MKPNLMAQMYDNPDYIHKAWMPMLSLEKRFEFMALYGQDALNY